MQQILAHLASGVSSMADFLWGSWLLFLLMGVGIFYTVLTGFVQVRRLPVLLRGIRRQLGGKKKAGHAGFSSLQVLYTAIASCVGSGNIVGVSTAILAGGPGALFWMWVAAFFGMATKFGEIVLGISYRGTDAEGNITGGPMYYIAQAFHAPWLGAVAAVLLFTQNAGATLIQSNTIATVIQHTFGIPVWLAGILVACLLVFVISGGFKRLVSTAENLVPLMAGLYIAGGLVVILAHIGQVPAMFAEIFRAAFSLKAGVGAAAGITMREAMRYGVARGLYSNEAGEGSAAVLHAAVQVDHPVRQGLYGVVEVFVDTMVICSTPGFAVLITGVWQTSTDAANLAAAAFGSVLPGMEYIVSVSLILFAVTSLMSQWYFGHVSLTYLCKPFGAVVYRMLFPVLILVGSNTSVDLVWSIQDCALGLLILPNIASMLLMAPKVRALAREFFDPANGYLNAAEKTTN